jgi:hypothetical protein
VSWTGTKDLKAKLIRLWERGDLLREAVMERSHFPMRLSLKIPDSADLSSRFDEVRSWAIELMSAPLPRLEFREVQHRVQGVQRLPASAWIDSLDDALNWLNKREEWNRFLSQVEITRRSFPGLLPWLEKYPLEALALAEEWPRLLAVVAWRVDNPRPNIYLRQVDLPGLHTKFIEKHRGVLAELLDLVLSSEVIGNNTKPVVGQFATRYGFLEKPVMIRFRVLDPEIDWGLRPLCPDMALDAESFGQLRIGVQRVFVMENEINFLSFPRMNGSMAIFGAGYGWEALARCPWLHACSLYYWGDIDTHGFGILSQLRTHFDHAESFLMDRATLDMHREFWGVEDSPLRVDLLRLTEEEQTLYSSLRHNSIREGLRLEQEYIRFGWVNKRLQDLTRNTVGLKVCPQSSDC